MDVREKEGSTALYIASQDGNAEIVELLAASGAGECVVLCCGVCVLRW